MSNTQVLELLTACHDRIRLNLRGLRALARPGALADPRAEATVGACLRYLQQGLLLHAQDEDLSLAPRLRALPGLPTGCREALELMEDQHEDIEDALSPVLSALRTLAGGGSAVVEPEPLGRLLEEHLDLEEAEVFPAVELLDLDATASIVREIRRRRGPT